MTTILPERRDQGIVPVPVVHTVEEFTGPGPSVTNGPTVGVTGITTATMTGPAGTVFVKWADVGTQGQRALIRETTATIPVHVVPDSPKVLAVRTAAGCHVVVFTFTVGTMTWDWSAAQVTAALDVLDRLTRVPPVGPLSRSLVVRPGDYRSAAVAAGLPSGLIAGIDRFASDLHDRVDRYVHGDPHPENWLTGPDGTMVLLDWEHSGGGPAGWDQVMLLSVLDLPSELRARTLAELTDHESLVSMVAVMVAKCAYRQIRVRPDRFSLAVGAAFDLWCTLTGVSVPLPGTLRTHTG